MEVDGAFRIIPAVVVFDWLDHIGQNAQRRDIGSSRHAMQHAHARRAVSQAEKFEVETHGIHAGVHGRNVGYILRRPQTLRDGRIARPDMRIDIFRSYPLRPLAGLAAENAALLFGGQSRGCISHGIDRIVPRRRPHQVEVVSER